MEAHPLGVLLAASTPNGHRKCGPEPAGSACRPPLPGLRPDHFCEVAFAGNLYLFFGLSFEDYDPLGRASRRHPARRIATSAELVALSAGDNPHPLGVLLAASAPPFGLALFSATRRVARPTPPPCGGRHSPSSWLLRRRQALVEAANKRRNASVARGNFISLCSRKDERNSSLCGRATGRQ